MLGVFAKVLHSPAMLNSSLGFASTQTLEVAPWGARYLRSTRLNSHTNPSQLLLQLDSMLQRHLGMQNGVLGTDVRLNTSHLRVAKNLASSRGIGVLRQTVRVWRVANFWGPALSMLGGVYFHRYPNGVEEIKRQLFQRA